LRSLASDTLQDLDFSVDLPAHGTFSFTRSISISGSEYALWKKGVQPLLVLKISGSDLPATTRTIHLLAGGAEAH
jgi:hypothetical protein